MTAKWRHTLASACLDTFGATFSNFLNCILWQRITDDGSEPEMRIWSILLIKSYSKWCIHLSIEVSVLYSHDIQEQGHNNSWVSLIALLFEVFSVNEEVIGDFIRKISVHFNTFVFYILTFVLKNCISDIFFLRALIFPHSKFLKTRNLHLLLFQTK